MPTENENLDWLGNPVTFEGPERRARSNKRVDVSADELTFGIEIECYLPVRKVRELGIVVGTYHHGYELPAPFPAGWKAESDGSLSRPPTGYIGVEVISPVLKGLPGILEVRRVVEMLADRNGLNARVNNTCGQHVHVGMRSVLGSRANDFAMVAEWARRLLHLVAKHETALIAITGTETRINNTYCSSIKGEWQQAANGLTYATLASRAPRVDRHVALNLGNLFQTKRTVEFRVFAGTLESKKSTGYILTALALCEKAAENIAAAAWDLEPTLTTGDAQYYLAAVRHLHERLAWSASASRAKFGFPSGAWELFGEETKRNQIWNAKHLAQRVARQLNGQGNDENE